ncbi:MAG: hypothetical protein GY926_19510 [bacterium]|nr:hypothetical protein [bacterium]
MRRKHAGYQRLRRDFFRHRKHRPLTSDAKLLKLVLIAEGGLTGIIEASERQIARLICDAAPWPSRRIAAAVSALGADLVIDEGRELWWLADCLEEQANVGEKLASLIQREYNQLPDCEIKTLFGHRYNNWLTYTPKGKVVDTPPANNNGRLNQNEHTQSPIGCSSVGVGCSSSVLREALTYNHPPPPKGASNIMVPSTFDHQHVGALETVLDELGTAARRVDAGDLEMRLWKGTALLSPNGYSRMVADNAAWRKRTDAKPAGDDLAKKQAAAREKIRRMRAEEGS